jgi:ABC-type nitrate/sulfonate/bicarbonate transport system substrate-binding protein
MERMKDCGSAWTRRRTLASLAAVPLAGAACPAFGQQPETVRIVNTSGNAVMTLQKLMERKGFLKEQQITPEFQNITDGSKLMGALLSGESDISMMAGFAQVLTAIEKGARLRLVAGALNTPVHAVYSKKTDIKSVSDLRGKTIGTGSPGALLHSMMVSVLRKNGIPETQVNFVNVGSNVDVFRAVVAGVIDAGPSEVDFFYQQDKYGVHALRGGELWKELPQFTFQATFASQQAIARRRDALVRTVAAYVKLYRYASSEDSKEDFFSARAAALGKNEPHEAETQWSFYRDNKSYATDPVLSEERVRFMQELNVSLGVQKRIVPYEDVVDASIARDAVKLVG